MRIYLATWLEHNQAVTLTNMNYTRRLMSYFFIKQDEKFDPREYVRKGVLKSKDEDLLRQPGD